MSHIPVPDLIFGDAVFDDTTEDNSGALPTPVAWATAV